MSDNKMMIYIFPFSDLTTLPLNLKDLKLNDPRLIK